MAGSRIVLVFLLTFLLIWTLSLYVIQLSAVTFESRAVVAFQPRDPLVAGAETMVLVTPKYVELLRSPEVLQSAATQLGISPVQVQESTEGQIQPNTLNLQIVVAAEDRQAAADQANVLAAQVVAVAALDPLLSGQIVAWSVAAEASVPPSRAQLTLLGLVVSLVAAGTAATALRRRGEVLAQSVS